MIMQFHFHFRLLKLSHIKQLSTELLILCLHHHEAPIDGVIIIIKLYASVSQRLVTFQPIF
jgi:hypothetical protein